MRVHMKTAGLIVMGVSGCGKTTVGKMLAERLGWDFFDGDDFHPPENVVKMRAGIPLADEDRLPWLAVLRDVLAANLRAGRHPILACSALKHCYRDLLQEGNGGVRVLYLKGSYDLVLSRMLGRPEHYMRVGMLRSQFDALEEPADAWAVDISRPPEEVVDEICRLLAEEEA
jgi:gluconokinase